MSILLNIDLKLANAVSRKEISMQEYLEIRSALEGQTQMKNTGSLLSNVAFNWAQHPGKVLSQDDCDNLKTLQKQWDEVSK